LTLPNVEEAFEEIQLDGDGIAAVLPRGPYLFLAVLAAGMEMVGEAGATPTKSISGSWSPHRVQILGIDSIRRKPAQARSRAIAWSPASPVRAPRT